MGDVPPYPGAPRWVKVSGLSLIALVVLFVIRHLLSGGLGHAH